MVRLLSLLPIYLFLTQQTPSPPLFISQDVVIDGWMQANEVRASIAVDTIKSKSTSSLWLLPTTIHIPSDSIWQKVTFTAQSVKRLYIPGITIDDGVWVSLENASTFVRLMDSLKTDSIIIRASPSFTGKVNLLILRKK